MKTRLHIIVFLFFFTNCLADNSYFDLGKSLFEKKEFENAKFKFEQDIVFNPKSELSYLYLAKIYKNKKKKDQEESNLNTVILLNPKNEEAIYNLALLNLEKSNFSEVNRLLESFEKVCNLLCSKSVDVKKKLKNSLEK